jgi:anti-sigma B factor antagonist
MNFSISEISNVRIVRVTENITYINQKEFFEMVETVVGGDCKKVILDLSSLKFLGSLGIGAITRFYQKMKKSDGELIIIRPPEQVFKVFSLTGLAKVIPFIDDEATALSQLGISANDKQIVAQVDESDIQQKIERLKDENPEVRRYIAWSLGLLRNKEAIAPLEHSLETDSSSEVRAAAADALRKLTGRSYTWREAD